MRRTDAARTTDGGVGRGVRLGGSDTGARPTGHRQQDEVLDDDTTADEAQVSVADYANLLEDEESADRRRDPLRN
jgi:hypothetical protein